MSRAVLQGYHVNAYFGHQAFGFGTGTGLLYFPQGLGQVGRSSPDAEPHGALVGFFQQADNLFGCLAVAIFSYDFIGLFAPRARASLPRHLAQGVGSRVAVVVPLQVGLYGFVQVEHIQQILFVGHVGKGARSGDEAFYIEFVGVEQEADHRLYVVRVASAFGSAESHSAGHYVHWREVGHDDYTQARCCLQQAARYEQQKKGEG